MKLVFIKTEEENVEVFLKRQDQNEPFDYGEMILKMYEDGNVEDAEIIGNFTDIEEQSIQEMITDLRRAIDDVNEQQEENEPPDLSF